MSDRVRTAAIAAGLLALALAGCNKRDNGYQGWIEANLIFVAPDEVGRVQTLSVSEGDWVKAGDTDPDEQAREELAELPQGFTSPQEGLYIDYTL